MAQLVLPHRSPSTSPSVDAPSPADIDRLFQQEVKRQQQQPLGYRLQQMMKRAMDFILAALGIVVLSPVLLLIAVLIKASSPGPVLYAGSRIGRNYEPFPMYKFRTMRVNADQERDKLREQANLKGELFKLENDPRITRIGQFLRKTSLDELPQLFNVIRGDMSLVGPRPLPPDESKLFEPPYTVRYQVFPGITGTWQVNGRSNSNFKQLCELELKYVANWTLWEDICLLFKTLPAVLASRGAC